MIPREAARNRIAAVIGANLPLRKSPAEIADAVLALFEVQVDRGTRVQAPGYADDGQVVRRPGARTVNAFPATPVARLVLVERHWRPEDDDTGEEPR